MTDNAKMLLILIATVGFCLTVNIIAIAAKL